MSQRPTRLVRVPRTVVSEGIPYKMLYGDAPPYGVIQAGAASTATDSLQLQCRFVDARTGSAFRRCMIYINGAKSVEEGSTGLCFTGADEPVLARVDANASSGCVLSPVGDYSVHDYTLRLIHTDTQSSTRAQRLFPHRYVFVGPAPSELQPSTGEDYQIGWVQLLGIDHSHPPMRNTTGALIADPSYSYQGSLEFTSASNWEISGFDITDFGKIHSTISTLSASSYGDSCLQVHIAGLWLFVLDLDWTINGEVDIEYESTLRVTEVADGHQHNYYDYQWDGDIKHIFLNIAVQKPSGGGWATIFSARQMIGAAGTHSSGSWPLAMEFLLDKAAELKIYVSLSGSGVDADTTLDCSADIHCHWISPE